MYILRESVVTASVELLLNKLASSELLSFARQEQIDADLKKWENILMKIYVVLEDAEEKQMTNRFVKKWLVDLKILSRDVEDILDEFYTKALERKLSSKPESSTSKLCKLIPTCSNPQSVKFKVKMGSEIKKITERLQEIVAQKNHLQLQDSSQGVSNKVRDQRLPRTSLTGPHVYGREKDQEAIVELLLKDDANEEKVSVIPIVGMGGIGKTTLAKIVYNDNRVRSYFDLQGWANISLDFDVVKGTRTILQSVISSCGDSSDLNQLQVKLIERLSKKKICIVLDDIWDENYDKRTVFFRPFRVGSTGSKIIVTTRSHQCASSMVSALPTYRFKTEKDNNGGGGDDGNNGSGGRKNEKKDGSDGNGNGNNDKGEGSDSGSDNNGGLKRKQMKHMFGYKFGYHAGNENSCPVGQFQCVISVDKPNTYSIACK